MLKGVRARNVLTTDAAGSAFRPGRWPAAAPLSRRGRPARLAGGGALSCLRRPGLSRGALAKDLGGVPDPCNGRPATPGRLIRFPFPNPPAVPQAAPGPVAAGDREKTSRWICRPGSSNRIFERPNHGREPVRNDPLDRRTRIGPRTQHICDIRTAPGTPSPTKTPAHLNGPRTRFFPTFRPHRHRIPPRLSVTSAEGPAGGPVARPCGAGRFRPVPACLSHCYA